MPCASTPVSASTMMASPYPLWPLVQLALAAEGQNPAQTAAQDGCRSS